MKNILVVSFFLFFGIATCLGQKSPSFDESPKRSYRHGRASTQEGIDFRLRAGINLNLGGQFESARCDLPDKSSNTLVQPAFGLMVASPFVDVTAVAGTAYGSYMAILLQGAIQGYPLSIVQPDLDLGDIDVGKLAFVEFGAELDDTRSPFFGTFWGFGASIQLPVGDGFGSLTFKRIRPTKPSTSFWQVSAFYNW